LINICEIDDWRDIIVDNKYLLCLIIPIRFNICHRGPFKFLCKNIDRYDLGDDIECLTYVHIVDSFWSSSEYKARMSLSKIWWYFTFYPIKRINKSSIEVKKLSIKLFLQNIIIIKTKKLETVVLINPFWFNTKN
jgi:hypothetical protein